MSIKISVQWGKGFHYFTSHSFFVKEHAIAKGAKIQRDLDSRRKEKNNRGAKPYVRIWKEIEWRRADQ